jgi:nucleoside phosphorylase
MTVGSEWARRNLGMEERGQALASPVGTAVDDQALQRELIDFDSEGPDLRAFAAIAPKASVDLSHYVEVPWPPGESPQPGPQPGGDSLPEAEVLIVTWTADEGHALSRVLTPGFDSQTDWRPYTKNFDAIASDMRPTCPARQLGRLGTYWTTRIGDRRVTLFKSDSHMSQDGPKLPNARVWEQIIADCGPEWVITTGTGGAIGTESEVGDVVVSRFLTFDCQQQFLPLDGKSFACDHRPPSDRFDQATSLFAANAKFLPTDNPRSPQILTASDAAAGVLTTDFFGFDNTANTYGLEGKGALAEMGDAVLGMVCQQLGDTAPRYVAVRNVSDPEIDSAGRSLRQQAKLAGDIYKGFGRWSTVCSAIVCWAIVAGL